MALIFWASSDRRSFEHSSTIIRPIVHWLFPRLPEPQIHEVILAARKLAHFTEYALLAILLWRALRSSEGEKTQRWRWSISLWTLFFVVLYAATDEFHQLFVPSRQASVLDVLLDSIGGIFALLLLWLIGGWRQRWQS